MKGRNMGKKQSLKERIIEVSWELFEEKGYEATTMNDITRKRRWREALFTITLKGKRVCLDTLANVFDNKYREIMKGIPADTSVLIR